MELAYTLRLCKEIFFPRKCAVCKTDIDTGLVCTYCRRNFLLQKSVIWGANQMSWKRLMTTGQPLVGEDLFDRVEFLFRYEDAFKNALHKLKFEAEAALLPLLREEAELALKSSQRLLQKHYDIISCIPTSKERLVQRGFDVPYELFRGFAYLKNVSYTTMLLQRVKVTAPLYTMAAEERREELAGCFTVNPSVSLKNKRILLCDDIYTTGSTMKEAAQVLLQAGAACVGVLAFCASKDNWEEI